MSQNSTSVRTLAAALIALIGSVIAWVVVPYNNFYLQSTYISDSFLPEIVIAVLLVLVLGLNPLLRLIGPGWMLDRRQLALIGGLLLFAAVIPSNGLMRMFPRFVAETNQGFHSNVTTARIAAEADLPEQLYPDPLPRMGENGEVQTFETPISEQLLTELYIGASIPWSDWVTPMATWGLLILAMWTMMLGLGGVVYPQWRNRERLSFPLLNVYQSLTGTSDEGEQRALPQLFYSKPFWIAVGVVFVIHAMRGLNVTTGAFPSFPLEWNLSPFFQEGILRHAPVPLKRHSIFFALIGVAYFMPNRYSISVWGWVFGYGVYQMFGRAYVPAFRDGQVDGMSFGMLMAVTFWVLWLGRSHWYLVGKAMLGRGGGDDESRRDSIAGWMFVLGCAGMIAWLFWAGCSLWFCIVATAGTAVIALLMARIIAETGIPALWLGRFSIGGLLAFIPLSWQSPQILLFSGVLYATVSRATAVSAAVMATMALGIDRQGEARLQSKLLLGGLGLLAVGFVICGAVHLHMHYNFAEVSTDAKTGAGTLNDWARVDRTTYQFFTDTRGDQTVGFGISAALLWACSRFPSWPVHPIGMLFARNSLGFLIWFSIFLGWAVKVTTTRLFGGGAYRKARPVFLGLIVGELLAVIFWALIPAIMVLTNPDLDPAEVTKYTLIQYP